MPASAMAAAFEHVEKTGEIGVQVGVGIDERMAHAGLSGKVHDRGKTMGGEQRRHAGTIRQIELRETKARETRELRKPRLLEFRIVIGVEIVDADDRVPVFAQAARNMKANESRRTEIGRASC